MASQKGYVTLQGVLQVPSVLGKTHAAHGNFRVRLIQRHCPSLPHTGLHERKTLVRFHLAKKTSRTAGNRPCPQRNDTNAQTNLFCLLTGANDIFVLHPSVAADRREHSIARLFGGKGAIT